MSSWVKLTSLIRNQRGFSLFIPWTTISQEPCMKSCVVYLYSKSDTYAEYAFLTLPPPSQYNSHHPEGSRHLYCTYAYSMLRWVGQIHAKWITSTTSSRKNLKMGSEHSLFYLGKWQPSTLLRPCRSSNLSAKTLGGNVHLSNHFAGQLGGIYKLLKCKDFQCHNCTCRPVLLKPRMAKDQIF